MNESNSAKSKNKRKVKPPHMCEVCYVTLPQKTARKAHYTGWLHKKITEIRQSQKESKEATFKSLEEEIEARRTKEPIVGLQYIYMYAANEKGHHDYECKLCDRVCKHYNIFSHVVGVQHRVLFLRTHHSHMGFNKKYEVDTNEKYDRLVDVCCTLERSHGRERINVLDTVYVRSQVKAQPDDSISFTEELREAHEANPQAAQYSENRPGHVMVEENFHCNEDLFDFLGTYKVENNDDVKFALETIDKLSNALGHYKRHADDLKQRISEEEKRLEGKREAFFSIPGAYEAFQLKARLQSPTHVPHERKQGLCPWRSGWPEADTWYSQHQRFPDSPFDNRGPFNEPRSSFGPGVDRSLEPQSRHHPGSIGGPARFLPETEHSFPEYLQTAQELYRHTALQTRTVNADTSMCSTPSNGRHYQNYHT